MKELELVKQIDGVVFVEARGSLPVDLDTYPTLGDPDENVGHREGPNVPRRSDDILEAADGPVELLHPPEPPSRLSDAEIDALAGVDP